MREGCREAAVALLVALGVIGFAACGGDGTDAAPTPAGETPGAAQAETATGVASPTAARDTPADTPTPVVFAPTFTCDAPIAPLEARLRRGETVELQGRVFGTRERNGDAILAVGAPLDALLRVEIIIPAGSRAAFPADPLLGFAEREVCVRGTVTELEGILILTATSPQELTIVE